MKILINFLMIIWFINLQAIEKNKTICLNMIVKDESKVIRRCLESVKPLIDHWIIVDTGSSDDTKKIINECLKDIHGHLYDYPWKNFEYNRNHALNLAKGKADYVLFIDADEELLIEKPLSLLDLSADAYILPCKMNNMIFHRIGLIKNTLDWKWEGIVHEQVVSSQAQTFTKLENITNLIHKEGYRSKNPKTFEDDACLLLEEFKKNPDNPRTLFYLAQSYRDARNYSEAIKYYKKRVEKGGYSDEVFNSLYQIAFLQELIGFPLEECICNYYKAHTYAPNRAEPLYRIAVALRKLGRYHEAFTIANLALKIPIPDECGCIDKGIYEYGLLMEVTNNAFNIERYSDALFATIKILQVSGLPKDVFQQAISNANYLQERMLKNDLKGINVISKSIEITNPKEE